MPNIFFSSLNFCKKKGCLDPRKIKYGISYATYQPNEDICNEEYKFGGTFAYTYHCTNLQCLNTFQPCQEVNVFTNKLECSKGYESLLIFQTQNHDKGPWSKLTECRRREGEKSLLYFGGIYSVDQDEHGQQPPVLITNPLTNSSSCPKYFSSMPLFDCQINRICLSLDEKAVSYAVPFGGFISSWMPESSQVCMEGYSKVRINTNNNCSLFYCAQFKSWTRPTIVKPPFGI